MPPPRETPTIAEQRIANLVNWMLFGANVFARGELARALDVLRMAHRNLLWLARLAEHATNHWPTPSKGLEQDLSADAYQRLPSARTHIASGRPTRPPGNRGAS